MSILPLETIRIEAVLPLVAAFDDVRPILLWFGLATLAFGVFLMFLHKRIYDQIEQQGEDERTLLFEHRKFRRRTMLSSLIATMGVIMASLNWAIEPMVFTALVFMILIVIIAILGLALLDMLSISLRGLAESDDQARQALVDAYLKQREKKAQQELANEEADKTEP